MIRGKSIPVSTLLAIFCAGAFAHAASQQAQPPTTLEQAVRVAEQETGGQASEVEMENEQGTDVYEVKTLATDGSAKVHVALASGEVVRVDKRGFFESIGNIFDKEDVREDQAELARLEATPMTLVTAIAAAEQETGGRAVEATMRSRYGVTVFEVALIKGFAKQKVVVDPSTGEVHNLPRKEDE